MKHQFFKTYLYLLSLTIL